MKGVAMKVGQLVSFIVDALPVEAQEALATLQAEAPPMAPELAERVLTDELGRRPAPASSGSGTASRSRRRPSGRCTGPCCATAGRSRSRSSTPASRTPSAPTSPTPSCSTSCSPPSPSSRSTCGAWSTSCGCGSPTSSTTRKEAANQEHFARLFAGHPFIRIPRVVGELSSRRVLVSDWADGQPWSTFEATARPGAKATAAEVMFRFAQGSIYRHRLFNGDPHPGNYRFHPDGTITFLDFGLVKHWSKAETDALWPLIDPLLDARRRGHRRADGGGRLPRRRPRPRSPPGLGLRLRPLPALPDRVLHVHPALGGRHAGRRSSTCAARTGR